MDRAVTSGDTALARAVAPLAPPGVLVAVQRVAGTQSESLMASEAVMLADAAPRVRQRSAAARHAARRLLRRLGVPPCEILKDPGGRPVWPTGIVGSLAHDDDYAIAVVAPSSAGLGGLGVDIEPAEPLPAEIVHLVLTSAEHRHCGGDLLLARLLFVIKEAVYKAVNPADNVFLDFHDVVVDLATGQARTRTGRTVAFAATIQPRLVAIARWTPIAGR